SNHQYLPTILKNAVSTNVDPIPRWKAIPVSALRTTPIRYHPTPIRWTTTEVLASVIGVVALQGNGGWCIEQAPIDIEAGAVTRAVPRQFCFIPAHLTFGMRTGAFQYVHAPFFLAVDCVGIPLIFYHPCLTGRDVA